MSGVLQRLAGRAIGQSGARLHALAQLPFQSPPGAIAQPTELQDQTSPSALQRTPTQQALPQTADAETAETTVTQHTKPTVRHEHDLRAEPIDNPAQIISAQPEKARTAASQNPQPSEHQATLDRSVPTSPLALSAATPEPMLPDVQPVAASQATQTPTAAAAEPQARAKAIGSRITRPKPNQTKTVAEPSLAKLPEALLPQSQAPERAKPSATSHKALPAREPDEVHVHIGRVEITAIQEVAPAKHTRRKGPAPLSLDDYLARRKGDGA
jgi:hypothetical protein